MYNSSLTFWTMTLIESSSGVPIQGNLLVAESLGQALKEHLKIFKIFFQTKIYEGHKIHQERQSLNIQEEFRGFAISVMGLRKYYIAHGHEYLDYDQGQAIKDDEICPRCGGAGAEDSSSLVITAMMEMTLTSLQST